MTADPRRTAGLTVAAAWMVVTLGWYFVCQSAAFFAANETAIRSALERLGL
jgi:hypothetical protein